MSGLKTPRCLCHAPKSNTTGVWHKRLYNMAIQNPLPPLHFSVAIVGALIGIVILLFGRKLFWLCVAAVGFAAGVELTPHLVHEPSPLLALTVAFVLGLIGALLALFLQKIAIAVLGFLAGGKLAGAIAAAFFVQYAQHSTIIFLAGGVVGAILLLFLFDWALIVVSSSNRRAPDSKRDCASAVRIDNCVHRSCDSWYHRTSGVPAKKPGITVYFC